MIIIVNDNDSVWKFDTEKDKEEEVMGFFEKIGKEGRTFSKMELEFVNGVTLPDINNMFENMNGEGTVLKQILTLNPVQ